MQLILTTSIDLVDTDYQRNVWGDSFQGLIRSGDLPENYLLVLANIDEEKNQVRVRYLSEGRVEGFDNDRMHVLDETNTVNENEAESISTILIVNPPGKSCQGRERTQPRSLMLSHHPVEERRLPALR